jgi:penicillin-binding protein 1A
MRFIHQDIYGTDGRWKPNDWFTQPAGVQKINNELYPSWYDKNQNKPNAKLTFDKVSKKKATDCTPDSAKIEIDVNKTTDPISKKDVYIAPDGYDATKDDDTHKCDDVKPAVGAISITSKTQINVSVVAGTHPLQQLEIKVGDTIVATLPITSSGTYSTTYTFTGTSQTITATLTDAALYTSVGTKTADVSYLPNSNKTTELASSRRRR